MSSTLYRLGRAIVRLRKLVLAAWAALLVLLIAATAVLGGTLQDDFTIPGTESQRGLDVLGQRFDMLAGASAQIVFATTDGTPVADHADTVQRVTQEAAELPDVAFVQNPLDPDLPGEVSDDGTVAIAQLQADVGLGDVTDELREGLLDLAERETGEGLDVIAGGAILGLSSVPLSPTEILGVVLALVVLAVTFRGLLAAGMPILTALIGTGVATCAILIVARWTEISATTPTLSIMLGLAVGIDYALFILSRHRGNLAQGMAVEESIARSVATAGSAVVFAGATVIIALLGLFIVDIPFLTGMGVAAAGAVAIAVLVALTFLPAVLAMLGERLRPAAGSAAARLAAPADPDGPPRMSQRWIHLVLRRPWVTIGAVVVGLALLAVPAKDMALGLPDNGTEAPGTPVREAYDVIAEAFGPGYNTPLLVTADIINTTDPLGVMAGLKNDIEDIPGVASVGTSTPNPTADLGIVQVTPEQGQAHPDTAALVDDLRAAAPELEERYGISDVTVTGQTAVAVDISVRLGEALVPFGIFVVGLSFLLLTVVFRSLWVPITAALGYVLSVLVAFGATAMVFEYGWLNSALGIGQVGPVISFMPIIVMGVLFGLAMDYEVFLVSRMREDWVHTRDAGHAIRSGFTSSARVVTAAALIMFSVFAFFVPESSFYVQPIAFALAVGVAVDAFVVRMTLIPAVLEVLGARAWYLPRALDASLPVLDVEGAALEHHLEHEEWTRHHGEAAIRLQDLEAGLSARRADLTDVDLVVRPGELVEVTAADDRALRTLLGVVTGRLRPTTGTAVVLDNVLPDEAGRAAGRTSWARDAGSLTRLAATTDTSAPGVLAVHRATDLSPAVLDALDSLTAAGTAVVLGRLAGDAALPATIPARRVDVGNQLEGALR